MTRRLLFVILLLSLLLLVVTPVMAAGMPDAHGMDGRGFGEAVSAWAQADPLALAAHASGGRLP